MYAELINWLHGHYIETGDFEAQQAADAIEKLVAEVERLHKENFWLSWRKDNV